MQPAASLQNAYNRAQLARYGISFDEAMAQPHFKLCLGRMAEALETKPINVTTPRHACKPHWQDEKG